MADQETTASHQWGELQLYRTMVVLSRNTDFCNHVVERSEQDRRNTQQAEGLPRIDLTVA